MPTHQCHCSSTHRVAYLLLILTLFSLNGFFLVFHSMACAFFLLFLQIWMSMPHWKKMLKRARERKKETKTYFETVEGRRFWGVSTTLIRDVGLEILPEDDPDTPLHLNIQQCVMLTEKQLTQQKKSPVLSAMCVTHLACEKAACLLYFGFLSSIYFCFHLKFIFVSIFDYRTHSFFFKAWFIMGVFFSSFFLLKN